MDRFSWFPVRCLPVPCSLLIEGNNNRSILLLYWYYDHWSCGNLRFQPLWPIVGAVLIYLGRECTLVNHVFCKTKQEILLRHMGIINIHGYCHPRVHAGVTPL